MDKILVIKHGALGDIILALGPLKAIRARHPHAQITILTTAPFADFLGACPYLDRVWVDPKPRWWQLAALRALRRRLRSESWQMVYDLQTSGRSSRYHVLAGRPRWSGIAPGCSHPHRNPRRDFIHTLERQAGQLADAGITYTPPPELNWVRDTAAPALPGESPIALLVPGGSAHRPEKRWPAAQYAAIAETLVAQGLVPVIIGSRSEADLAEEIRSLCPTALDLTGKTDLLQLATLGRRAKFCIGNDTGPMHLFAATGTPSVVLFSAASDPTLCAPRGPNVTILRQPDLADLPTTRVAEALDLPPLP